MESMRKWQTSEQAGVEKQGIRQVDFTGWRRENDNKDTAVSSNSKISSVSSSLHFLLMQMRKYATQAQQT